MRYLTGNTHPDHDTICTFRRNNQEAIAAAFVQVLELARELKRLKLGIVSLDGTQIRANASKDKNVTDQRAQQLRVQLQQGVQALMAQAEQADQRDEDPQRLPEEIARREALLQKMDEACARLDAHAQRRYEYRPLDKIKRPKRLKDPVLVAMAEKLKRPEGRALDRRRVCTVEPVFGVMKAVLGFGQLLLRGLEKVGGEWALVCLAYNVKRQHRLGGGAGPGRAGLN